MLRTCRQTTANWTEVPQPAAKGAFDQLQESPVLISTDRGCFMAHRRGDGTTAGICIRAAAGQRKSVKTPVYPYSRSWEISPFA